jgi:hypothetical protein
MTRRDFFIYRSILALQNITKHNTEDYLQKPLIIQILNQFQINFCLKILALSIKNEAIPSMGY